MDGLIDGMGGVVNGDCGSAVAATWMIVGSKPSNFELQLGWLVVGRVQLRNFTPNPVPDTYDQLRKTPSFFLHVCAALRKCAVSTRLPYMLLLPIRRLTSAPANRSYGRGSSRHKSTNKLLVDLTGQDPNS